MVGVINTIKIFNIFSQMVLVHNNNKKKNTDININNDMVYVLPIVSVRTLLFHTKDLISDRTS